MAIDLPLPVSRSLDPPDCPRHRSMGPRVRYQSPTNARTLAPGALERDRGREGWKANVIDGASIYSCTLQNDTRAVISTIINEMYRGRDGERNRITRASQFLGSDERTKKKDTTVER